MDLAQVTLAQMRYAVAVDDARSFRQAAERCHVSQSGLSMQIGKLEELLGVALFDRRKKPLLVTPDGAPALAQMRAVLRETERLGQVVAESDEPSGRFRLGVIPTLSPTVLPLFLGRFAAAHPRVELTIEELKTEDIIARLRADTLDAGLVATPLGVAGLREEVLGRERMLAYLSPGDPLLRKKTRERRRPSANGTSGSCPRATAFGARCCRTAGRSPGCGRRASRSRAGASTPWCDSSTKGSARPCSPSSSSNASPPLGVRGRYARWWRRCRCARSGLVTARTHLRRRVSDALVAAIRDGLAGALPPTSRGAVVLDPLSPVPSP